MFVEEDHVYFGLIVHTGHSLEELVEGSRSEADLLKLLYKFHFLIKRWILSRADTESLVVVSVSPQILS